MKGAIIHHAEESTPGINLVKATISEGYLICGFLNRAFYSFILYKIIKVCQPFLIRPPLRQLLAAPSSTFCAHRWRSVRVYAFTPRVWLFYPPLPAQSDARLARSFNPYVIAALTNIGVWLAVTTVRSEGT